MAENEVLKNSSAGKPFIDFTIEQGGLDGAPVSLSDYAGQGYYLLLDFWASWCGPCKREIPNLKALYDRYGGEKFQILSIAVWDQRDKSLEAIEEFQMNWLHIIDAGSIPTELYGIKGIPQIILLAPDGTIVGRDLRGGHLSDLIQEVME